MPLGLCLFFLAVTCPRPLVFAQPNKYSCLPLHRLGLVSWVTALYPRRGTTMAGSNAPGAFLIFSNLLLPLILRDLKKVAGCKEKISSHSAFVQKYIDTAVQCILYCTLYCFLLGGGVGVVQKLSNSLCYSDFVYNLPLFANGVLRWALYELRFIPYLVQTPSQGILDTNKHSNLTRSQTNTVFVCPEGHIYFACGLQIKDINPRTGRVIFYT